MGHFCFKEHGLALPGVIIETMQSYKLSFTALSLAVNESIKVAEIYLTCRDWGKTGDILHKNNILQSRTASRNVRVVREIIKRLSALSEGQLDLLVEGDLEEQRLLLWFTVCKYYPIIREFAEEVLHQKFLGMQLQVSEHDFLAFFLRKVDHHPELEKITASTQDKIRTQIFRMAREAGLINQSGRIIRIIPSRRLSQVLAPERNIAFTIYPAFPRDFEG